MTEGSSLNLTRSQLAGCSRDTFKIYFLHQNLPVPVPPISNMPATLATSSSSLPEGPPINTYLGRYNGAEMNGSPNTRTLNKSKRRAAQQIYTSMEPSMDSGPLSATVTATATEGNGTTHKRSLSHDLYGNGFALQVNEKLPISDDIEVASPFHGTADDKAFNKPSQYSRNSFIDSTISRFLSRPETPSLSTRHTEPDTRTWSLPSLSRHFHISLSDNFKFIILCLMWYSSSAFTNNIGKQILMQFRYPVTLTYVQFGLVALSSFILTRATGISQIRKPDLAIIKTVLPLAGFQIVGHVFSSVAISRVPVSLVHTIKVSEGVECGRAVALIGGVHILITNFVKIGAFTIVHCTTLSISLSSSLCFRSLYLPSTFDIRCYPGLFIYIYYQCIRAALCPRFLLSVCTSKRLQQEALVQRQWYAF